MRNVLGYWFFIFTSALYAQQSDFSEINFDNADYKAGLFEGEDLYHLPLLVQRLTYGLDTDVERFRSIYFWVTHNIEGDALLTDRNLRMRRKLADRPNAFRKWEQEFRTLVFERLLKERKTLCSGYSYLIKKMALLAGLECQIINGIDLTTSSTSQEKTIANHSWNRIKLNGTWYFCDATWSAGYSDMSQGSFVFDYDDSYFLMDVESFRTTHKSLQ